MRPTTHPLGGLFIRTEPVLRRSVRARAVGVLAACAAIIATAAWLDPAPRGVGTHAQLGLAPCSWITTYGVPCPTCGMTTAVAYAVRGQWWQAFVVQPAGAVFAVVVLLAACVAAYELISGVGWRVNWYRVRPRWVVVAVVVLVAASWIYKLVATRGQFG